VLATGWHIYPPNGFCVQHIRRAAACRAFLSVIAEPVVKIQFVGEVTSCYDTVMITEHLALQMSLTIFAMHMA